MLDTPETEEADEIAKKLWWDSHKRNMAGGNWFVDVRYDFLGYLSASLSFADPLLGCCE